jgi:hypothetical protein
MSYSRGKVYSELWVVADENGMILETRGGSSSSPRLMVYSSEGKARAALKSPWIRQIIKDGSSVQVAKVYSAH